MEKQMQLLPVSASLRWWDRQKARVLWWFQIAHSNWKWLQISSPPLTAPRGMPIGSPKFAIGLYQINHTMKECFYLSSTIWSRSFSFSLCMASRSSSTAFILFSIPSEEAECVFNFRWAILTCCVYIWRNEINTHTHLKFFFFKSLTSPSNVWIRSWRAFTSTTSSLSRNEQHWEERILVSVSSHKLGERRKTTHYPSDNNPTHI